jgi:hypothetical protein
MTHPTAGAADTPYDEHHGSSSLTTHSHDRAGTHESEKNSPTSHKLNDHAILHDTGKKLADTLTDVEAGKADTVIPVEAPLDISPSIEINYSVDRVPEITRFHDHFTMLIPSSTVRYRDGHSAARIIESPDCQFVLEETYNSRKEKHTVTIRRIQDASEGKLFARYCVSIDHRSMPYSIQRTLHHRDESTTYTNALLPPRCTLPAPFVRNSDSLLDGVLLCFLPASALVSVSRLGYTGGCHIQARSKLGKSFGCDSGISRLCLWFVVCAGHRGCLHYGHVEGSLSYSQLYLQEHGGEYCRVDVLPLLSRSTIVGHVFGAAVETRRLVGDYHPLLVLLCGGLLHYIRCKCRFLRNAGLLASHQE